MHRAGAIGQLVGLWTKQAKLANAILRQFFLYSSVSLYGKGFFPNGQLSVHTLFWRLYSPHGQSHSCINICAHSKNLIPKYC